MQKCSRGFGRIIAVLLGFLTLCGVLHGDFELMDGAQLIRANGNQPSQIVGELRRLDLCGIVQTGDKLVIRDVKLSLEDVDKAIHDANMPRLTDTILFKWRVVTDDKPSEGRTKLVYNEYIRLRLNGLTSLGALKILKLWFDPNDRRDIGERITEMPVAEFEKLERIPEWLLKMLNPEYFASRREIAFYLFRDGDLVWLLEQGKDAKYCSFTDGFDGKHINSNAFGHVFEEEYRAAGGGVITPELSLKLTEQIRKKWGLEWYSTFDVPTPGAYGPPK